MTSWYEAGETWGGKFGQLACAYEECRAEAVGYVLCCDEDILKLVLFAISKIHLIIVLVQMFSFVESSLFKRKDSEKCSSGASV